MQSAMSQVPPDWKEIKWVLTDVDDTLTWQGKLPPETLIALSDLRRSGIKVVAVTGACAGWCDHIAQLWPVDAVLGENGAFVLEKSQGCLTIRSDIGLDELKQKQQQLKAQVLAILEEYPDVELTLDQSYRLCEVAIDIGQNRAKLAPDLVEEIISQIHELGAHATASSIHINAWYGEHSKRKSSLQYLKKQGLSDEEIDQTCCYVGDSLNDQYMFEALSKSVGVANISHYWDKLISQPKIVTKQSGGYGFAEFAEQLLDLSKT